MGDPDEIKVGDKVTIFWETISAEWRLVVLRKPQFMGDCWTLRREDGTPIDVMYFAKMVKESEIEPPF